MPTADSDNDDLEDVASVLAGDVELFSRLVERHGEAIGRQMRSFSPVPEIVEELTHEVFVAAYIGLAHFRNDAPFRHWLARIATITGYRYWKTRGTGRGEVFFDDEREHAPNPDPPAGDPDAASELLHEMLAELPDADRMILGMMYFEGCKHKEIARRLGCSKTAASVRIYRARKRLKKLGRDEKWRHRVQWMIS